MLGCGPTTPQDYPEWSGFARRRERECGSLVAAAAGSIRRTHQQVPGALDSWEPSPQRTPVLYQAGASDRGRVFAARHAECVFINASTKQNVGRLVADLRIRAAPRPMLVFVGASVVTGRSEKEARELLAEYRLHASVEGALAYAAASLGIDFARYGMDEPIDASSTQAIRSNVEAITASLGPRWSKRRLIDRFVLGSRQPPIVGSPEQVADQFCVESLPPAYFGASAPLRLPERFPARQAGATSATINRMTPSAPWA
jgi:alkanesulfonate monooxygenase SsuD/methylene tetrahydromethanopterin reductase-like flavin-dependent oxidoreductase (luciferase family)